MIQRTERHIVRNNKQVDNLCFKSKNLYNCANYIIRQEFINNRKWIKYQTLDKLLQKEECYKELYSQSSQQILRLLDKNWSSFFKAIKVWKVHPELFTGRPSLPKYKDKEKGRNIVVFTNQQITLKEGFIYFPKRANLEPIKTYIDNVCQVRIVPQATCYVVEIIYKKEIQLCKVKKKTYLGVDLGVNNLATCVNNVGLQPFIVNGRSLKSINQYYNKKLSVLKSYVGDKSSNRIQKLTLKRNNKIRDYLHKTSCFIVNYCIQNQIETIIIGKNNGWKQEINNGKKNNQNFVFIPFDTLIKQISYKAEDIGINVVTNEESYTSKCSFLDLETIEKHKKYAGRRVKRGIFKSSSGIKYNADVNGAYNIMRKVVPNALSNGIEGVGLHPFKISLN